jgi:glycerate 2-kinase
MPRFLAAPDSFKGTFGAPAVAGAIAAGLEAGGADADRCPMADGGEGTAEVLRAALGGVRYEASVHDPLRRPIAAGFVLLGDGRTAALDIAAASGLPLLAPEERDPERTDTYGTGELIAAAIEAGARRVLVAVGGSATTDGGAGAIEALREHDGARGAALEVLCDVTTPFEDAARVFGPQKGADAEAVERLTARLQALAEGMPADPRGVPMSGAAGGLAGGLMAAFGARLLSGADFVLDTVGFDERLAAADAAIGGEGRLDAQSFEGKIVGAIAARCARAGKPLHLIVGSADLGTAAGLPIASISKATTIEQIEATAGRLARFSFGRG